MDEQTSPPDIEGVERKLVTLLERRVRWMMNFTGWEDDCDDDARRAVLQVRSILNDLDALRRIRTTVSASTDSGKP